MIRRIVEIEVVTTPEEVAMEFCAMDEKEQARFFNEVAAISATWNSHFVMQLQSITDCPTLTEKGRDVMRYIGEYSEQQ